MDILTVNSMAVIDTTKISKGCFIRAKYEAWKRAVNGIVSGVHEDEIRVLYIGEIGNVTNYFTITAEEIGAGLWGISWSEDFTDIFTYEPPEDETEGDEPDDT